MITIQRVDFIGDETVALQVLNTDLNGVTDLFELDISSFELKYNYNGSLDVVHLYELLERRIAQARAMREIHAGMQLGNTAKFTFTNHSIAYGGEHETS